MEYRRLGWGSMVMGAVSLMGCLEPESNFQDPTATSTSSGGGSTSISSSTTTSTGGPSTNTATNSGTSTTSAGSSSTSGASVGSTGSEGTTGGELPDNDCLVKDAYGDLGMADDALGFFVDVGTNRSTGVDVFLTDSNTEPFDTIIIQLYENTAPFNNVPQPGMYDIEDLGGLDACGGICISINADATFDMDGYVVPTHVLRATAGQLNITGLQWDANAPTNGMVEGNLQNAVFEEYVGGELVAGGCMVTLDAVSFSEPVTSVVPP